MSVNHEEPENRRRSLWMKSSRDLFLQEKSDVKRGTSCVSKKQAYRRSVSIGGGFGVVFGCGSQLLASARRRCFGGEWARWSGDCAVGMWQLCCSDLEVDRRAEALRDRRSQSALLGLAVEPGLEHEEVPEVEVPVSCAGEVFLPFLADGGGVGVAFASQAGFATTCCITCWIRSEWITRNLPSDTTALTDVHGHVVKVMVG